MSKEVPPCEIVDAGALEKAAVIPIWSEEGETAPFASLFTHQKTIVIFIRYVSAINRRPRVLALTSIAGHFLCGTCQAYVEELGRVPKAALDAAGTRIVVIGCGNWDNIAPYKEISNNYPYEMYTDPTRQIHQVFELNSWTMEEAQVGGISFSEMIQKRVHAAWTFLTRSKSPFATGNITQVGGDFVLGPGLKVSYAHRMKNAQDHVEVPLLMQQAGVAYDP